MAVDPATGELWQNEHGPQGGDELNLIRAGSNYGWPEIGYGVNYTTALAIHEGTHKDGRTPPVHVGAVDRRLGNDFLYREVQTATSTWRSTPTCAVQTASPRRFSAWRRSRAKRPANDDGNEWP